MLFKNFFFNRRSSNLFLVGFCNHWILSDLRWKICCSTFVSGVRVLRWPFFSSWIIRIVLNVYLKLWGPRYLLLSLLKSYRNVLIRTFLGGWRLLRINEWLFIWRFGLLKMVLLFLRAIFGAWSFSQINLTLEARIYKFLCLFFVFVYMALPWREDIFILFKLIALLGVRDRLDCALQNFIVISLFANRFIIILFTNLTMLRLF